MGVVEQVHAIGEWSLKLRDDTPQSVLEAIAVDWSSGNPSGGAFSHIVITTSPVDVTNAGLSDAAILSASRYTGVVTRPGPQLRIGGRGLAWWLADGDNQPWNLVWSAHSAVTWATAYGTAINSRLTAGSIASGGSFTVPAQQDISRRNRVDAIALAGGHEWRINPDGTFDADTVANLYGSTPTVVLTSGASARGGALVGLAATFLVEEDWEQWGDGIRIETNAGYTSDSGASLDTVPSDTLVNTGFSKDLRVDARDVPQGYEQTVANAMITELNQPRYEITVDVTDPALVEHVRCGDLVYVYDEFQGLHDLDNQVVHNGRAIWPKVMRATRMSWPVTQGMGVYWRTRARNAVASEWVDLTPYVEWEDGGGAQVDIIQGDAARHSLNPATGRVDTVGAAIERAQAQPRATYTPTWGSSGTAPALVNGSLVGRYRRHGTDFDVAIQLTWGSSTTGGTGMWTLSMPATIADNSSVYGTLSGFIYDSSAGRAWPVTGYCAPSGTVFQILVAGHDVGLGMGTAAATGSGGSPFAWASGDILHISGRIEIAP